MFARLIRLPLLCCLIVGLSTTSILAQSGDLRSDKAFFQRQVAAYNAWLVQNKLNHILRADSIGVQAQKVTLYLRPMYRGRHVCDSIQSAWEQLEASNRKQDSRQFFRERLLHKWAFLAEVPEAQAEVVLRCHSPAHFLVRINSSKGQIPSNGFRAKSGNVVQVPVPATMQGVNNGANIVLLQGQKAAPVCAKARQYLINFYRSKGTPILWRARVDTAYTLWDEFIIEVTHLSHEICPDGYFEYHRIYVKALQKGDDVEFSWEFQGKYGSGIIFPPRKNDYKDMDIKYRDELTDYQGKLFRRVVDAIKRR